MGGVLTIQITGPKKGQKGQKKEPNHIDSTPPLSLSINKRIKMEKAGCKNKNQRLFLFPNREKENEDYT